VLSENVSDVARISAEHLTTGHQHPGVLIALSSRFSRRRAGISRLVTALVAVTSHQFDYSIVYLDRPDSN
jgi:hypothetical protein